MTLSILLLALSAGLAGGADEQQPTPAPYAGTVSTADESQSDASAASIAPGQNKPEDALTFFRDHFIRDRYWISGQANFIFQDDAPFHSPYMGPNSLKPGWQGVVSRVMTLFVGAKLAHGAEVLAAVEETGGKGIGAALGLAGYVNLDVVRNPSLGQQPYLARLVLHQTIALSSETAEAERTPFSFAAGVPRRRIELRAGKFSTVDFFDLNAVGSDSHLQFTNWTVDNNGAYDYAADTRGYTWGVVLEYQSPRWGVRFGELLMPTVANGIHLDWALRRARAENLEFEIRPTLLKGRATVVRPLVYLNHAHMGSYRAAIDGYLSGRDPAPNIVEYRRFGAEKPGVGLNAEQELPHALRAYMRLGWNPDRNESFAYTEVGNTVSFGLDVLGTQWGRPNDRIGSAFVSNGLGTLHREYLALGGLGFLLGDGRLNYARETISETYYTAHAWRGLYASGGLQFINNPGYNKDRGPVVVPMARVHMDF